MDTTRPKNCFLKVQKSRNLMFTNKLLKLTFDDKYSNKENKENKPLCTPNLNVTIPSIRTIDIPKKSKFERHSEPSSPEKDEIINYTLFPIKMKACKRTRERTLVTSRNTNLKYSKTHISRKRQSTNRALAGMAIINMSNTPRYTREANRSMITSRQRKSSRLSKKRNPLEALKRSIPLMRPNIYKNLWNCIPSKHQLPSYLKKYTTLKTVRN